MAKINETINIQEKEGKFFIERNVIDELTAEELLKVEEDIKKAKEADEKYLDEEKKKIAKIEEDITKNNIILNERLAKFEPFLIEARLIAKKEELEAKRASK